MQQDFQKRESKFILLTDKTTTKQWETLIAYFVNYRPFRKKNNPHFAISTIPIIFIGMFRNWVWVFAVLALPCEAQTHIARQTFTTAMTLHASRHYVFENCHWLMPAVHEKSTSNQANSTAWVGVLVGSGVCATFINCTFSGFRQQGKGMVAAGEVVVQQCVFQGLAVGVELQGHVASLTANTFIANHTAIRCNTGDATNPLNLTLKCNRFEPGAISQNEQRFGLVVDDGTLLNRIGGADDGVISGNPNANAWPVVDRTVPFANWVNPVGWVSLENNSGLEFHYWKYENEYLLDNFLDVFVLENGQRAFTALFPPTNPIPGEDVEVCNNFTDYVFPVTRPRAGSGIGNPTTPSSNKASLGQAEPNPAGDRSKVEMYLPNAEAVYHLQLWDVSGKKLLRNIETKAKGNAKVEVELGGLSKGIYLYRLTENGVPVGTKKLAIH